MPQNAIIRLVYETIENPQKRSDFVAVFAEVIDAIAAALRMEDRQLRWASLYATHGMDRATIDSYCQYYVGLNPLALLGANTAGEVRTSDELLSEKELRDTEFYHGWLKPRGWMHTAAVALDTTETERAILVVYRPPNHPFAEKEMAIVKNLAPHLALATQIQKRQMALQNTINRLRSGTVEIDALIRFNLSPTESRIAAAIAQGQTPKEYAHKAGLTANTVRWHVKRIYKKLGVRSRADLTRLLLAA